VSDITGRSLPFKLKMQMRQIALPRFAALNRRRKKNSHFIQLQIKNRMLHSLGLKLKARDEELAVERSAALAAATVMMRALGWRHGDLEGMARALTHLRNGLGKKLDKAVVDREAIRAQLAAERKRAEGAWAETRAQGALVEGMRQRAEAASNALAAFMQRNEEVAIDRDRLQRERDALAKALQPFARINSSCQFVTINVRSEDVRAARTALAEIQK